MSHVTGRAKQHPRGGMPCGIRGSYGGRVGGADAITPRTSTPIPYRNPYTRPGLAFGVNLDEDINKAAEAQAETGLP